jgi:hypothetical protein
MFDLRSALGARVRASDSPRKNYLKPAIASIRKEAFQEHMVDIGRRASLFDQSLEAFGMRLRIC